MGFSLFGKNKQSASGTDTDELEGKATPRRRKKNAEQPVDPVLPEKKRARRRLVGAAAMVLAAIIGLPLLLESEPQPLADDIQIYIPSVEKPVADIQLASSEPVARGTQPASASSEPEEKTSQVTPPVSREPAKPPPPVVAPPAAASTPSSAAKASADSKTSSGKTDKAPVASAASAPAFRTDASKPAQSGGSTESERAAQVRALLEGKSTQVASAGKTTTATTTAAADAKSGKFVLQVAALGSAEKAKELQDKLSKAGIKSYTEKVSVSGNEQIRVRVGPFASREEADRMRGKLSGLGFDGMVMSL